MRKESEETERCRVGREGKQRGVEKGERGKIYHGVRRNKHNGDIRGGEGRREGEGGYLTKCKKWRERERERARVGINRRSSGKHT